MKRRKLVKEYATERLRLVAMKRNNILPNELRVSKKKCVFIKSCFKSHE